MVQSNKVHPFIEELYFSSEIIPLEYNILTFREKKKRYQIINQKIEAPFEINDSFLEVIQFIKDSFCVSNDTHYSCVVMPSGWILKNELKNHESIKLLSQYFNLELIVDIDVGQILSIYLSNR